MLCSALMMQAQRFSSFSNDPDKTVEEMKVYLSTVNKDRQKDADALLEEFTKYWTTSIDGESQMAFLEEANKLLKHKFRPLPHRRQSRWQ